MNLNFTPNFSTLVSSAFRAIKGLTNAKRAVSNTQTKRTGIKTDFFEAAPPQAQGINTVSKPSVPLAVIEDQEKQLAKLKEKISEKKKEFEELANSTDGIPEEKMDLERALKRMDKLLEIPQSELLRNHPEIFNDYVGSINKLLECNARKLNLILACTQIPTAYDLEGMVIYLEPEPKNEIEVKEKLNKFLQKWETDIDAFYLPGLPIVVHTKSTHTEGIQRKQDKHILKENGLSEDDQKKLKEAAKYIVESKWLEVEPDSLKNTEAIFIVEDAPALGASVGKGHQVIELNKDVTSEDLAVTIVHEDKHFGVQEKDGWGKIINIDYDREGTPQEMVHPWIGKQIHRVNVLSELETYACQARCSLHLIQWGGLNEEQQLNLLKELFTDGQNSKTAIQILKEHPDSSNKEIQSWVSEIEKLWQPLYPKIKSLIEDNLPKLATSEEWKSKDFCYEYLIESYKEETDKTSQANYLQKFFTYINKEDNCMEIKHLAMDLVKDDEIPNVFKELIMKRFTSEEIQSSLKETIDILISKKDTKEFGYDDISECYDLCKGSEKLQNQYFEMFKNYISKEDDRDLLIKLSSSKDISPQLQQLVKKRLESLPK